MSGKKYFPNDWEYVQSLPDEAIEAPTVEEFFEVDLSMWLIPSSVACVIRTADKTTGKIKEYTYQRESAAAKRLEALLNDGTKEVTVCSNAAIYVINPNDGIFNDRDRSHD